MRVCVIQNISRDSGQKRKRFGNQLLYFETPKHLLKTLNFKVKLKFFSINCVWIYLPDSNLVSSESVL